MNQVEKKGLQERRAHMKLADMSRQLLTILFGVSTIYQQDMMKLIKAKRQSLCNGRCTSGG